MKYDMRGFLEQCVERYLELSKTPRTKLRVVETPFIDEGKPECDENETPDASKGTLGDIASAVLMKVLYAGRMGRFDLLRPVNALASKVTKWTKLCDKQMHRLICYVNSTLDEYMYAWVTDKPENMELVLYCDADLAGDRNDAKSTSGIFLCLMGPNSFVPLSGISKKQTSVSKSTPEAEIVAIDHGICKEGIPALYIWEKILGRKLKIKLMEDNQAASRVVITGKNPSMRHMSRTQRIDISWLNERYSDGDFEFIDCPSEYQAADIFTKFFTDGKVWTRNLRLIGIFGKKVLTNQGAKDACPATNIVAAASHAALFIKRIRERMIPVTRRVTVRGFRRETVTK
jgi:hypothetical protein